MIFTTAEDNLPQILKRLRAGATLPVTAYDRTGNHQARHRRAQDVRQPDRHHHRHGQAAGGIRQRDDSLFPNQFVNVRLLVDAQHDATIIPTSAIQRGAPGTFVYLVNADSTVAVRPVTLGVASGERVAVSAGPVAGRSRRRRRRRQAARWRQGHRPRNPLRQARRLRSPAPASAPAAGAPASAAPPSERRRRQHPRWRERRQRPPRRRAPPARLATLAGDAMTP